MAEPTKITRMVITVHLDTGEIDKVVGMNDADINNAIAANSVPSNKLDKDTTLYETYQQLWRKNPKFVGSIFWTHSSPGCGWVLQDGWYQYICS
jgi:hypothetical protein